MPDVLLQPHPPPCSLSSVRGTPSLRNIRARSSLRGSWNREVRTGYKIIRAFMEDGKPTGVYEDFMTGFVLNEPEVWGRPTGIAVTPEGALLVSDDANGTIFRVTTVPRQSRKALASADPLRALADFSFDLTKQSDMSLVHRNEIVLRAQSLAEQRK